MQVNTWKFASITSAGQLPVDLVFYLFRRHSGRESEKMLTYAVLAYIGKENTHRIYLTFPKKGSLDKCQCG